MSRTQSPSSLIEEGKQGGDELFKTIMNNSEADIVVPLESNNIQDNSTSNNLEGVVDKEDNDEPIQVRNSSKLQQLRMYVWQIAKLSFDMLPMGFLSFGGPLAHTSILQDRFVINHQWLTPDEFSELFSICQSLPGPLSTKLVIAIGTLRGGYMGALMSFLIFSLPSGLVMGVFGVLMKEVDTDIQFPQWVKIALSGFSCAAVSIIFHAGYMMAKKLTSGSKLYQSLMIGAFVLFLIYQTWWMLLSIMIFGGLSNWIGEYGGKYLKSKYENFSNLYGNTSLNENQKSKFETITKRLKFIKYLILEATTDLKVKIKRIFTRLFKRSTIYEQVDESKSSSPSDIQNSSNQNNIIPNNTAPTNEDNTSNEMSIEKTKDISLKPMMGMIFMTIFILLLLGLFISRQFIEWTPLYLAEGFFRISSLIFGGGHVILPVILNEFSLNPNNSTLPTISENQFLNGFALQNALPGPLFNLSAFVGGVIGGPLGAFISWFCSFLPPFLFMWTAIPLWNKYRDNKTVKIILAGVNASSVGFVFVAGYVLWLSCVERDFVPSSCTVVLAVLLQSVIDAPAPLVILSGGLIRLVLQPLAQNS